MKITCEQHDLYSIATLRGELTKDEVDQFRKTLVENINERARDVVLDMSQISFVDSEGLESLLWLQDHCLERLGQIRLAACNENVTTILRITRLNEAIESHRDLPTAIQSLQA